uniref:Uncharacterized protein n=1 Tax=Oryza punctata TaxID=4537 RepID=A0A0E0MKK5_ORYPU
MTFITGHGLALCSEGGAYRGREASSGGVGREHHRYNEAGGVDVRPKLKEAWSRKTIQRNSITRDRLSHGDLEQTALWTPASCGGRAQ